MVFIKNLSFTSVLKENIDRSKSPLYRFMKIHVDRVLLKRIPTSVLNVILFLLIGPN